MAHDFNNVLTAAIGSAQLALEAAGDGGADRSDLVDVVSALRRGEDLTRQFLAFGRPSSDGRGVDDAAGALAELERLLARLSPEGVELRVAHVAADLGLRIDPARFQQVVVNLVANAFDAMGSGGTVRVSLAASELDDSAAGVALDPEGGPWACLRVADDGAGMDGATLEQIFEPFFPTKSAEEGTGLGLATVRSIVEQVGGAVWVYSVPSRGTTVKAFLPRSTTRAALADDPSAADGSELPRVGVCDGSGAADGTVLVVEDDPAVRRLVARVLRRRGYQVIEAGDGAAAEAAARSADRIDLLFTDPGLPDVGGTEVARGVRSLWPGIPVIFSSGYPETDEIPAAAAVFLEKPFGPAELLRTVRRLLDGGGPAA